MRSYVGLPYKHLGRDRKGVDCYGLIILIYKEKFGIELPNAEGYEFGEDACNYLPAFYKEGQYKHVADFHKLWTPVEQVEKYDVILFNVYGEVEAPTHSGLYLGEGKFIHCMHKLPVTINRLEKHWLNMQHSIYRFKERLDIDGST